MQAVYEYVFTTLILILIFTASIASLLNIVETPMRHIQQQQLFSTAETVLEGLLGYEGDPSNWGSNVTLKADDLRVVGLSKSVKTDIIYDLDPDKLARLLPIGTGASINESTLNKLLNLGGSVNFTSYGFSLTLTPVLNISVRPVGYFRYEGKDYACKFLVNVTTHEMTPVGNVNLTVTILTAYVKAGEPFFLTNGTRQAVTGWYGNATLDYGDIMGDLLNKKQGQPMGTVLLVVGNFFGMQTMAIYQCGYEYPVLNGISIGRYLIVEEREDGPVVQVTVGGSNTAEITFNNVVTYKSFDVGSAIHGKSPWITDYNNRHFRCFELNYMEPDIFCIVLTARQRGASQDDTLVVFHRIPQLGLRIGSGSVPRSNRVVAIRRVVFVEKMAFFADFYFWRKFET